MSDKPRIRITIKKKDPVTEPKPKIVAKKKPAAVATHAAPVPSALITGEPVGPAKFPREVPAEELTISFDVGIINLAYCILYRRDDGEYHIVDWNIINMANGDPKLTCCAKIGTGAKAGSVCGKKAYYYTKDKKIVGYCAVHGKGHGYERNVTVDNATEFELKCKLFRTLDAQPLFLKPKTILIETQPLKAREKIKGVGHAIFDYYVLRGVIDQKCLYRELRFVDAKNKLTVYTGPPLSCHLKDQYARNKWYGKQYCQWFISKGGTERTPELAYFEKFPKKDDLADCFLQAVWYIGGSCGGGGNGNNEGSRGKAGTASTGHSAARIESNKLLYQRTRPRLVTAKGAKTGRYSLANIRYCVNKYGQNLQKIQGDEKLKNSIEFFFGGLDYFMDSVVC